jgi:hypothetical protein
MKLIIQIPCFNEAETLPVTLKELPRNDYVNKSTAGEDLSSCHAPTPNAGTEDNGTAALFSLLCHGRHRMKLPP